MQAIVYSSVMHTQVHALEVKHFRLRCETEETLFCKIVYTRQYFVQNNTHIKFYHLYITETFKIYFEADINSELFHIYTQDFVISTFSSYEETSVPGSMHLSVSHWIIWSQRQGSQLH
jgi:hypothetical protein